MDRITLFAIGLFAFAWLTMGFQSQKDGWDTSQIVGMFVFITGATCGVFLDNLRVYGRRSVILYTNI